MNVDEPGATTHRNLRVESVGTVTVSENDDRLTMTNHVRGGNSGSPIFSFVDGQRYVIGIANAASKTRSPAVVAGNDKSAARDYPSDYRSYGWSLKKMKDAYPDLSFWPSAVNLTGGIQLTKDLSPSISFTVTKSVQDDEHGYTIKATLVDQLDLKKLYVNGI